MMKICENGIVREMTLGEIEAMKAEQPTEQQPLSFEERLYVIEKGFKKIEKFLSKLGE